MRTTSVAVAALLAFCLASCAGTPSPGEQASNAHHRKCERTTGSLLCGNADDQILSNPYAPNSYTPSVNGTRSEQSAGPR